ncbi:MAG: HAD hydrolase-like protein [Actinomycetota bacterium]|nr:HAD hydrolase-like protein [Actinomycetota bacterium]MDP3630959.1 HAD hydrolase-like protein [Actinomycetota bacterium]
MIRGILFDLDGTLLEIDLQRFLGRYFAALRVATLSFATTEEADVIMDAVQSGTRAMMDAHPGITNAKAFALEFKAVSGTSFDEVRAFYDRFYDEVFPTLIDGAGPVSGARRVLETAQELGLRIAIATNPIFPRAAVEHRLTWAGLGDLNPDVLTTYENMLATKPHPGYFSQTAELIGIDPHECLMVGDDRYLDMPAADIGMRTFYVGTDLEAVADYRGTLDDLADLLPRLASTSSAV